MRKTVALGLAPQAQQLVAHQEPRLLVERAERLVEQDQPRLHHERARDAHALAHPAGELRRIARREVGQADELQHVAHALVALLAATSDARRRPNATLSATSSHGSDASSWNTTPMPSGASPRDRPAFELDRSLGRRRESRDQLEQRRLAAARRADDGEELAAPKLEIERAERVQRRRRARPP